MLTLALDTALPATQVALHDSASDTIIASLSLPMMTGHAEALLPAVEECLRQAGVSYAHLARVGVTTGPGSFTGVRIALSAARAMALALALPVIGITTLDALTRPHLGQKASVLAVNDARRGELYVQLTAADGTILIEPGLLTPQAVIDGLPHHAILAIGSGTDLVCALSSAIMAGERSPIPAIAVIARLAAFAYLPDHLPRPLYLRAPDAKPQTPVLATS